MTPRFREPIVPLVRGVRGKTEVPMNEPTPPRRDILRWIFITLLSLGALLEVVIGVAMIVDFETVLTENFGATYNPDLGPIGLALGCNLLFLGAALALSASWTRAHKREGPILGMAGSMVFVTFGIVAFVQFGQVSALVVDAFRGVLTVGLGALLLRRQGAG